MFLRYIFAPYLIMGLLFPTPLDSAEKQDDSSCGQRTTVLDYLSGKYSEKPIAMGIAANGGLIEVLTSTDGTTFTIIVTMPEGKTCMVAAGEAWENLPALARRPQI